MPKLEIERKFLLKALPVRAYDDKITIDQYYWKNKHNVWERARTYHSEKNGDSYIHTVKKSVSKMSNMEEERELTKDEFDAFKDRCFKEPQVSKYINKERYIYKFENGLKWEVDVFDNGYKLIIAEIEIPKKTFKVNIPDYISDVLLLEVTGMRQFSNRALSLNILDINKYNL